MLEILLSVAVDAVTMCCHSLLPVHSRILIGPQHGIALPQRLAVELHLFGIGLFHVEQSPVDELAPLIRTALDQFVTVGGDNKKRNQPDQIR